MYQQNYPPPGYGNWQPPQPPLQTELPNATLIMVFGILSIVFCTLLGLIFGIISLTMSTRAMRDYEENPQKYTSSSYSNVKTGRICSIIGISLSALATVFMVFYFIFMFSVISSFGHLH